MLVKICGITNRDDAAAAVDAGAGALGFNFWTGSPRFIPPHVAAGIAASLPDVLRVGVFVNASADDIRAIAAEAGLDVVQLHGDFHPPEGLRVWRAVSAKAGFEASMLDADADAFLLDTPAGDGYGGTGRTFDWSMVPTLSRRIVLAGGLDASNVRRAIESVRPWGVDACSRLESTPGIKDHNKVAEFCRAALDAGTWSLSPA